MLVVLSEVMDETRNLLRRERGMITKIAAGLGITHGAVSQWKVVPSDRVVEIERITGIPRHELRPDLHLAPNAETSRPHDPVAGGAA